MKSIQKIVVLTVLLTACSAELPNLVDNYQDAMYTIDDNRENVHLFGNSASGDIDGDSVPDEVFLYTKDDGGSGTFFYVVAALKRDGGYLGTNPIFLGDRIAPQTTEIRSGKIIVNYAIRNPTDPMTTAPSIGTSMYLTISGSTLLEVTK